MITRNLTHKIDKTIHLFILKLMNKALLHSFQRVLCENTVNQLILTEYTYRPPTLYFPLYKERFWNLMVPPFSSTAIYIYYFTYVFFPNLSDKLQKISV